MTSSGGSAEPVAALRAGDRRRLARLISEVENGDPAAEATLRALYPYAGRATVVGLTGPLGVGKSSLLNALLAHLRRIGRTVAVVAIDPSSPFSGGSVLGDRIRLDRDPDDPGVYVRSMASRGHWGGISLATRSVVRVLDAVGFEVILVETVGSGQVDVEIRDVASTRVVVLVPHLGDEVQTLKAGLFEIADVFCVNKSDLPGSERAEKDLADLAALGPARDGWRPPVVRTSTVQSMGIEALWSAVEAHEKFLDASGGRAREERRRISEEIVSRARARLDLELEQDPERDRLVAAVLDRRLDPGSAAAELFARHRPRAERRSTKRR